MTRRNAGGSERPSTPVGAYRQMNGRAMAVVLLAVLAGVVLFASSAQANAPAWRLLGVTGPTNLPPVTKEIQAVSIAADGGTFSLSFGAQTTPPLPFDATATEVQAALEVLPSVAGAGGSVVVGGGPGGLESAPPFFVSFQGALAGANVDELAADGAALTGPAPTAVVETVVDGGPLGKGELAVYPTNVGGADTSTPTALTIGPLPNGITTEAAASGVGWICPGGAGESTVTCNHTGAVEAGETANPVKVPLVVAGAVADAASSAPVVVAGGGASTGASYDLPIIVSETPAESGVQAFWAGAFDRDGNLMTAAGDHPFTAITAFLRNTVLAPSGEVVPAGELRNLSVNLPPGFIGNPLVTSRCPQSVVAPGNNGEGPLCGASAIVGEIQSALSSFGNEVVPTIPTPLYNDVPAAGYPAQFSAKFGIPIQSLLGSLRSDEDFGVTVTAPNVVTYFKLYGSFVALQGEPASAGGKAFFTNPSNCQEKHPVVSVISDTWQQAAPLRGPVDSQDPVNDCAALEFEPEFSFQPSASSAATGTSASAHIHVDQAGLLNPDELAPPHLKKSVVTLPEGLTLNPAAADGLAACSTAQIGLKTTAGAMPNPIRFSKSPVTCPDASKIGTAEIETPLLEDPLAGTVYLATQEDNPFKSLLAMYIVIDDKRSGTVVKLPGEVIPNPTTGQLTAVFDYNPQVPFEDLELRFRGGGPRSTMATPDVCGKYATTGTLTPWSAPESGPPTTKSSAFVISAGVGGSAACPQTKAQRPFALGFEAGTTNPTAGGHSPFTLRITRPDGNQELDKIDVTTPPGFAATLKGVTTCPEAAIAAAGAPDRSGKAELADPSCPASSQIGTTAIGAGVGSEPFFVKTGKVYLTGPYKGGPLSFAFIVPAVAGPFDLGVQIVRTALRVNPVNAQITAESDPIPQMLKGIPLQIRDVRVDIDRPGFALNPTNCEAMSVAGRVTGGSGAVASLNNRFQVGNCSALGFKPNVKIQLHGGAKRGDFQRVVATVTAREGDANIARAAVTFPHSAFLAQEHLDKICTRVQFAAKACPARSIYGYATAITPLLDELVRGPVYLRSNPEHELPDLVAALRGPDRLPIEVELQGRTDSKNAGIRNTFDIVPDVAVTKFTMQIKGGNHALIVNSRDLCKGKKQKATVRLSAQNGKVRNFQTVVGNDCGKKEGGNSSQARLHR